MRQETTESNFEILPDGPHPSLAVTGVNASKYQLGSTLSNYTDLKTTVGVPRDVWIKSGENTAVRLIEKPNDMIRVETARPKPRW